MPTPRVPNAGDALFPAFTGLTTYDPDGTPSGLSSGYRIDGLSFYKPMTDMVLKLQQMAGSGGGGIQVWNATGSTLNAGPVAVSGYHGDDSVTGNPVFKITKADVATGTWANAFLLSGLANATAGVAYLSGTYTSATLDTTGSAVGNPVYLASGGGETLTLGRQVLGVVRTLANPGTIAAYLQPVSPNPQIITKYKTSDTSVTNSTTLVTDADLQFPIGANEAWAIQYYLWLQTATTSAPGGDTKVAINGPSSPSAVWIMGMSGWLTGSPSRTSYGSTIECQSFPYSSFGWTAGPIITVPAYVKNGSNAGTITLQWAQQSAHLEANTLRAGSYMIATRVG